MKKIFVLLVGILAISIPQPILAQNVNDFKIDSFEADYHLSRDENGVALLSVTEDITATFPSFNQNHGIERAIPQKYRGETVKFSLQSVTNASGKPWNYSTRSSADNTVLRIGDANKYVHGPQRYVIKYNLTNVVRSEDEDGKPYGHDELYWDVNGDEWMQNFGQVTARLHIPAALVDGFKVDPRPVCYTGRYGSNQQSCDITTEQTDQEKVITFTTRASLGPRESLTFVAAFDAGTFQKYIPPPPNKKVIIAIVLAVLLLVILPPLLAFVIMFGKWRRSGRDPKGRGVIVPQYQPNKGMNPVLANLILSERIETKSISATIIDLCVRGYCKLYEAEKKKLFGSSTEYKLELLKETGSLDSQSKAVAIMLFPDQKIGSMVAFADLSKTLFKAVQDLAKTTSDDAAALGYFELGPEEARKKYRVIAITLLVIGAAGMSFFFIGAGFLLAGVIILIFSTIMPKRTQQGVEERDHLKGLEMYMKLAEADRIKFLQSPETAEKINVNDNKQMVKLYEKLLPYAVLFGIEKDWAKQFADLYGAGQSPSWYSGSMAFNAAMFSNAISNFNSAAVTSFAPPSNSGSSGFSGGGFSGGGGGGGGGGGW